MAKSRVFERNTNDNLGMEATQKKKLMKTIKDYGDACTEVEQCRAYREIGMGLNAREAQNKADQLYRKIEALLNK